MSVGAIAAVALPRRPAVPGIAWVAVALVAMVIAGLALPSLTQSSATALRGSWDEQRGVTDALHERGIVPEVVEGSLLEVDTPAEGMILLEIDPQWGMSTQEEQWLLDHVRSGGTFVLCSDSLFVDPLLRVFRENLRLGNPIRQTTSRSPPTTIEVYRDPGPPGVPLLLEGARAIHAPVDAEVLLRGASQTWEDVDGDSLRSLEEYESPPVVGVRLPIGLGHVVVLGDGGIFDRRALVQAEHRMLLLEMLERTGTEHPQVILDLSHRDAPSPPSRAGSRVLAALAIPRSDMAVAMILLLVGGVPLVLIQARRPKESDWAHQDQLQAWRLWSVRSGRWESTEVELLRATVLEGWANANGATLDQVRTIPSAALAAAIEDPVIKDLLLSNRQREPAELHIVAHYLARIDAPDLGKLIDDAQASDGHLQPGDCDED